MTSNRNPLKTVAIAAIACLAVACPVDASTSAYQISGTGSWSNEGGSTWGAVGYEFTTATPISVTHLGVHDWDGDGLNAEAQVGIWDSTIGNLVATVTVPTGGAADLVETDAFGKDYLQALPSPVILPAGTYVIANRQQGGATEILGFGGGVTMASGIAITKGWAIAGGGIFQDPRSAGGFSNTENPTSYIGPQFKFDAVTGPNPNTEAISSEVDDAYAADVSASDLVNNGQTSLTSFASSVAPVFGPGGQNDGQYGQANENTAAAWYQPPASLPASLTFKLNVTAHPAGYEISAIRTFAGWKDGGTQTYANQKYTVEYRPVGSANWVLLRSVDYSPFTNLVDTPANTKVSLTAPSGLLATGVAALRFNLELPSQSGGAANGTVLREIDVIGQAVGTLPQTITLSNPSSRTIVQRSAANTGSIPVVSR